jgi:transcriptional regulator with XRE-family HTH domain
MFRDKLKKLREDRKISQYELADLIHVSRGAVSKWERGKGIPSKCNLITLCQYFEVTEEELLDRNELILEIEKSNKYKENIKYYLPCICISIVCLVLTALELFVFVREGIQISNPRYYPNLSILTILNGWSLIPMSMYITLIVVDFIFIISSYEMSSRKRLVFSILSGLIVILLFVTSFVIAYKLVEPQNYGMFWKPH